MTDIHDRCSHSIRVTKPEIYNNLPHEDLEEINSRYYAICMLAAYSHDNHHELWIEGSLVITWNTGDSTYSETRGELCNAQNDDSGFACLRLKDHLNTGHAYYGSMLCQFLKAHGKCPVIRTGYGYQTEKW